MVDAVALPARISRPSADPTRQRILAATLDLFSERSFEGATTREIASRCVRDPTAAQLSLPVEGRALAARAVDALFDTLSEALSTRGWAARRRRADGDAPDRRASSSSSRRVTRSCTASSRKSARWTGRGWTGSWNGTFARCTTRRSNGSRDLVERGELPDIPAPHLYYIVTGAGPTMFVLGPECRRLSGLDPNDPNVIEAHADRGLPVALRTLNPKDNRMQH